MHIDVLVVTSSKRLIVVEPSEDQRSNSGQTENRTELDLVSRPLIVKVNFLSSDAPAIFLSGFSIDHPSALLRQSTFVSVSL